MSEKMERCCGTCRYHRYEEMGQDYVCVNADSENVADFTGYSDTCDEWEGNDED